MIRIQTPARIEREKIKKKEKKNRSIAHLRIKIFYYAKLT
jgi:hypothetical protein